MRSYLTAYNLVDSDEPPRMEGPSFRFYPGQPSRVSYFFRLGQFAQGHRGNNQGRYDTYFRQFKRCREKQTMTVSMAGIPILCLNLSPKYLSDAAYIYIYMPCPFVFAVDETPSDEGSFFFFLASFYKCFLCTGPCLETREPDILLQSCVLSRRI